MHDVLYGYCHCGCGERTNLAPSSRSNEGIVRGTPQRYLSGHNRRSAPQQYDVEDRGYETPCWVWARALNREGYGVSSAEKRAGLASTHLAYRMKWEQLNGPVPDGLVLDHLCRVRACVNPEHLEPVTPAENVRRSAHAKLTVEDVHEIRRSTATHRELGARYGVSHTAIGSIKRNKVWKDV